jgi:IgGFc binding protein
MRRPVLSLFLLVSVGWAGCSSERSTWNENQHDFGAADAGIDQGCAGVSCSRDLRSVVDCSGNVVRTCEAHQACGNGDCIAPCSAAAVNEGSVGCSFAIPGPNTDHGRGSCFAFFVANNWTSPATLHLEFKGEELSLDGAVWLPYVEDGVVKHKKIDGPIPPGGGAVVFLSNEDTHALNWIACPPFVKPVFDRDQAVRGTGIGNAVSVRADVPVSMYSMYPYGGATGYFPSATLLLPTSSFRSNYVLASAWGGQGDGFGRGALPGGGPNTMQSGAPTLQIVAIEDGTSIDLLPKVDVVGGGGISPAARNDVTSYTLQRGEVLQLTQDADLTGSVVDTNKPVGVFGGHTGMYVPSDVGFADAENNQIPPVSAWGNEYAVLPAPNRVDLVTHGAERERDPSPIRMVGAANGSKLVYEPIRPEGSPDTLEAGQLAVFFADEPFVVRSQDRDHPFFVAAVMTGAASSSTGLGDPEVAMVVPTDQWLDNYGFFTDYTYRLSSVFVTRRKVNGSFPDVTLDCAGVLSGWRPITGDFEWTSVELTRYGEPQTYPSGSCTDGTHRIHSDGPFAMTVWGLGYWASYAYPGGTGLRPITEVRVPVR